MHFQLWLIVWPLPTAAAARYKCEQSAEVKCRWLVEKFLLFAAISNTIFRMQPVWFHDIHLYIHPCIYIHIRILNWSALLVVAVFAVDTSNIIQCECMLAAKLSVSTKNTLTLTHSPSFPWKRTHVYVWVCVRCTCMQLNAIFTVNDHFVRTLTARLYIINTRIYIFYAFIPAICEFI